MQATSIRPRRLERAAPLDQACCRPSRIHPDEREKPFAAATGRAALILVLAVLDPVDVHLFPQQRFTFALIRAAYAGESLPARSSLVANSSAWIW